MNRSLDERLAKHPELRAKLGGMLDILENAQGDLIKANDAEERILAGLQQIGNQVLTGRANPANE